MPSFSLRSLDNLATCHPDLTAVFLEVIKHRDCTILEGVRSRETQAEYVRTGRSQRMDSRHLKQSDGWSHAVDAARYPVDWSDAHGFSLFAGFVLGTAQQMLADGKIGQMLRSGVDWDDDGDVAEHSFFDGPHFELIEP